MNRLIEMQIKINEAIKEINSITEEQEEIYHASFSEQRDKFYRLQELKSALMETNSRRRLFMINIAPTTKYEEVIEFSEWYTNNKSENLKLLKL